MFSSVGLNRKTYHLAGPIQLVNHSCTSWNARYVHLNEEVVLKTTRHIAPGEELLVHYEQRTSRTKNTWSPGCQCCPTPGTLALTDKTGS